MIAGHRASGQTAHYNCAEDNKH